jgi:hypothetical protein
MVRAPVDRHNSNASTEAHKQDFNFKPNLFMSSYLLSVMFSKVKDIGAVIFTGNELPDI